MAPNLLEALKEKKLVIGNKEVQQGIIANSVKEVFLAANCPEQMKSKIKALAGLSEVPVKALEQTSEEIGALCKKPFAITVAAIKKTKE